MVEPDPNGTPEQRALTEIEAHAKVRPETVDAAAFKPSGVLKRGYGAAEVDAFLNHVEAGLNVNLWALAKLPPATVQDHNLRVTRAPGYLVAEVDAFLDKVVAELTWRWEVAEYHLGLDWTKQYW